MVTENRIRELRHKKNMTLKELGNALSMRDNTLSQYENNKREPKLETWRKLANFFNVSVEYLMGLSDQPHVPKYETDKGVNRLPATGLSPLSEDERAEGGYIINAPKPSASDTLRNIVTILMLDDEIDLQERKYLIEQAYKANNLTAKTVLSKIYSLLLNEF
ncbi:helix-turn-helix domain-containing protein [Limosilactobacillus reuteri]|uniref:helix-turn-helix domain-containing protein n=1 Tax=Limosilactobacillus reuteri TaxID=1598 RepID=UPI001E540E51|nr:helix-turn-helix transcriptional regulator [Limosilactobacillus reuteri]MCC4467627.1 helix-turn-helix domain-containing protein [Limosilactobacillus reuteri]MCC4473484.1 helix-turn-helix domain-containing protein [Limosilactobacillus reuteri]